MRTTTTAAASSERLAYEELQAYTLSLHDPRFIHQYVVDAWTLQNADETTKPMKLAFALLTLCLHARGVSGKQCQRFHMTLAKRRDRESWPEITLPKDRGRITAADVVVTPAGPQRDQAIDAWCKSLWEAYGESHAAVEGLLKRHGIE